MLNRLVFVLGFCAAAVLDNGKTRCYHINMLFGEQMFLQIGEYK